MREILFRGQIRRYGEKVRMGDGQKLPSRWVYGGVLQGVGDHSIIYGGENPEDPADGLDKLAVYTDTIGQFTGLTDKNGKKIFEGDIVHGISIWDEANLVVIFEDGEFRMVLSEQYKEYKPGWGFYAVRNFNKEVIGNIHDNPELLGGKDGN
jgi:hypothetical protein